MEVYARPTKSAELIVCAGEVALLVIEERGSVHSDTTLLLVATLCRCQRPSTSSANPSGAPHCKVTRAPEKRLLRHGAHIHLQDLPPVPRHLVRFKSAGGDFVRPPANTMPRSRRSASRADEQRESNAGLGRRFLNTLSELLQQLAIRQNAKIKQIVIRLLICCDHLRGFCWGGVL